MTKAIKSFLASHQKALEEQATPFSQREAFELAQAAQLQANAAPTTIASPRLTMGGSHESRTFRGTSED